MFTEKTVWNITKLDQIENFGLSKKAAIVSNFCLIGNIHHNFLIPRMIESVPKTFMPIQTPDLHRVSSMALKHFFFLISKKSTVNCPLIGWKRSKSLVRYFLELDKNWAKTFLNFDTFYLKPLRPCEVKKVLNGWLGINFHYSGSHWTSVFCRFCNIRGHLNDKMN